jgi:hypothetical protein
VKIVRWFGLVILVVVGISLGQQHTLSSQDTEQTPVPAGVEDIQQSECFISHSSTKANFNNSAF